MTEKADEAELLPKCTGAAGVCLIHSRSSFYCIVGVRDVIAAAKEAGERDMKKRGIAVLDDLLYVWAGQPGIVLAEAKKRIEALPLSPSQPAPAEEEG